MNTPDKKIVCLAKFEGRCAHCDGLIEPGDKIELKRGGWEHEDCPADPPDIYDDAGEDWGAGFGGDFDLPFDRGGPP